MKIIGRLEEKYKNEIRKSLLKDLELGNIFAVPKLEKVVINTGIGEIAKNKENQQKLMTDLALITGQKPSIRNAKKSVAGFNLRRGMPVGLTITLRGSNAYNFLDKLTSIVLPRLRDFKGLSNKSFDDSGNYTLGIAEHSSFPEIDINKTTKISGLEITMVISSRDKEKSKILLERLGMPFEKSNKE